ncbi:TRM11 family methyltransferase [Saccharolobus islandicus]|jgi:tRNA (guanine10-N2)-dimethyltransferase|uniref:TRM11 family SAM-dependent methyltransferase n=1 Tax=Saccharolobus islandicus TaxID=43080 RepID=UPI00241CC3D7|nr:TRM11 family methyltransferase [Sulfolobus islandicus]
MKTYAVLKGNNYFLSLAELKAMLNDDNAEINYFTGVAIFEGNKGDIAKRSARIKRSGELIYISDDPKKINEILRGGCFWIKEDVIMGSQKNNLNAINHEIKRGVKVSKECEKIDIILTDGVIILGKIKGQIDSKSLLEHEKKPFSQSGTMSPETSRLLVNLCRPKKEVLDPFVGTGSILIEARWLNYDCIGSDLDKTMLQKTKTNLNYFHYDCNLLFSSATNLPFHHITSIATDPPYGRSTKNKGAELMQLYEEFFSSASETLTKGGFLVFATDSRFNFIDKLKENSFIIKGLHYLYSHKSLTRAIYVVQKK